MSDLRRLFLIVSMVLGIGGGVQAQDPTQAPTFSDPALEKERQKLLLERMRLENEKLKFEVEKAKIQVSPGPVTVIQMGGGEGNKAEQFKALQAQASTQAEKLAAEVKEQPSVLVFDFANSEFWHHGVRYQVHILEALGRDLNNPLKPKMKGRLPDGYPRNLYSIGNISLLRYQGRDRGIFEWVPPKLGNDYEFRTPEGITQGSTVGEIRNSYQSNYFSFEWQREEGDKIRLRYKHSMDLAFDDKLEFLVSREGKILKVRYGVLDEK